jgi:hypothetical protein
LERLKMVCDSALPQMSHVDRRAFYDHYTALDAKLDTRGQL